MRRAITIACYAIVAAFLIHNLNAFWLEPTYLGFEDPATDYADMAKVEAAIGSFSWVASGIGHLVTGFSFMVVGVGLFHLYRPRQAVASTFLLVAAFVAGLGFLLTGIIDIPGQSISSLLREHNPDHNTDILLTTAYLRSTVNVLAIVGLSWFAGTMAWIAGATGTYSKGFVRFGWVNALPGVGALVFPPIGFAYITLAPVWIAWLGRRVEDIPGADVPAAA